jgi:hypothetical protein
MTRDANNVENVMKWAVVAMFILSVVLAAGLSLAGQGGGQSSPWSTVLVFISGMVSTLLVEYLKRRIFKPKLVPVRDSVGKAGFVITTKVPGRRLGLHDARYLRIGITNTATTIAKDCRVYMTEISELTDGQETPTPYNETLRLRWAYEGEEGEPHQGIDIPKDVTIYFDVYSSKREVGTANNDMEEIRVFEFASKSAKSSLQFKDFLQYGKTYRLKMLITAEGANSVPLSLDIIMGNGWDQISLG